ncbi:MAG: serine hydrolase [Acidobacteriota bacterium]|nr:serine hydrolase [Acidobacteriota bacterium]
MTLLTLLFLFSGDPDLAVNLREVLARPEKPDLVTWFRKRQPAGPQPGDEGVINNLGYRYMREGKLDQALAVFQLNVALFPHKANPYDSLAESHLNRGEYEAAVAAYEKAFQIEPSRYIWRQIGHVHKKSGNVEEQLRHAERGTIRYKDADAADAFLSLRLKFGRVEAPLTTFKKQQELFPRSGFWRSRRALADLGIEAPERAFGLKISNYESAGLDPAPFRRLVAEVNDGVWEKLDGVAVVRGDALIAEAYFGDFTAWRPHNTRSVGKSITALIAGIAVDRGLLALDSRLYDSFPQYRKQRDWQPAKDEITLVHLLGMSSGLHAFDNRNDSPGSEDFYQSNRTDWAGHVLGKVPMAFRPGSRLVYASANYLLVSEMVAQAAGATDTFAETNLFAPLGISEYRWFRAPDGKPYGAGGIEMTTRDLALIGKLLLDKGMWRGRRLVSQSWIEKMTKPRFKGELWKKEYGLGWYCHSVRAKGRDIGVVSAAGNGGQRIWVMPDLDAVVVTVMSNYNSIKQLQADKIIAEIIVPSLIP